MANPSQARQAPRPKPVPPPPSIRTGDQLNDEDDRPGVLDDDAELATERPPVVTLSSPKSHAQIAAQMQQLDELYATFRHALSGFLALEGSVRVLTGKVAAGERKRGMPIFEFTAPAYFGAEPNAAVRCAIDLKKMSAQDACDVMSLALRSFASELSTSLRGIAGTSQALIPVIAKAFGLEDLMLDVANDDR
jgi:hypothetical protein